MFIVYNTHLNYKTMPFFANKSPHFEIFNKLCSDFMRCAPFWQFFFGVPPRRRRKGGGGVYLYAPTRSRRRAIHAAMNCGATIPHAILAPRPPRSSEATSRRDPKGSERAQGKGVSYHSAHYATNNTRHSSFVILLHIICIAQLQL